MTDQLEARLAVIFAARDRDNMAPTIDAFLTVLAEHPDDPLVLYEVGGAYDAGGHPTVAAGYYERALDMGLEGETIRRCYLQYGSTLKNLGRLDESIAVFAEAREQFPDSEALVVFEALTLHAAGRTGTALGSVLVLLADHVDSEEIRRYESALRGYAAALIDGS